MARAHQVPRPRAWIGGALLALLLLAGIGALIWHDRRPTDHPALFRVSQGDRHFWLFGTIHAVPPRARWFDARIAAAVAESDRLVLEVAGLEQERRDRAVFERLGRSPGLPPLAARLDGADRARLDAIPGMRDTPLDAYEDWAAALLVSAAANGMAGASAREAPEALLDAAFRANGRPVGGLETIEDQLGRFDRLSPADQRLLLAQAINEASDAAQLDAALYRCWARGDLAALERLFLKPLAASPQLRDALLDARNRLWIDAIDARMREPGRVAFVAVGAGHLVGPGNLAERLAARGWSVQRVQ